MTWTLLAHLAQGSTDTNGFTSSSIDTTGADFLWVHLSDNDGTSTISDSKGNTWQTDGPKHIGGFGGAFTAQYYVKNASGGTGHTFTVTCTAKSPSIEVMAWSGSDTTAPLDQQNSAPLNFTSTGQPGSITPGSSGELILTGATYQGSDALSINSSMTISDQITLTGGAHFGGGAAYLVQTSAAAINPTWTEATANLISTSIASFKAGSGGGPTPVSGSDSATLTETANKVGLSGPTDSAALAEHVANALGATDSATLAENIKIALAATDSAQLGEAMALALARQDTATLQELVSVALAIADAASLSESASVTQNGGNTPSSSDSGALTDTTTSTAAVSTSDIGALAEQAAIALKVTDVAAMTEQIGLGLIAADSAALNQQLAIAVANAATDSAALAEVQTAVSAALAAAEAVHLGESATVQVFSGGARDWVYVISAPSEKWTAQAPIGKWSAGAPQQ